MTNFNADTAEQFSHDDVDAIICPDCDGVAGNCSCTFTLTNAEYEAEMLADAQQEALLDDTCYCDDVDMCPPCARSYAAYCKEQEQRLLAGYGDTTPSVKLTREQQALFDAELPF